MLKERINEDLISYIKSNNKMKKTTLRTLKAEIKNEEISQLKELNDKEIESVISRLIKQYKESLEGYKTKNDLAAITETEEILAFLYEYMPEQLTEDNVKEIILSTIKDNGLEGKGNKGAVMKLIMPILKGKFDGTTINKLVDELL